MALRLAIATCNAMADAAVDRLDLGSGAGKILVRTGPQPATPETTATGTLLLTFTLNDPAFNSASSGTATLDVTPVVAATGVAAGTAGWFRALDSDNNPVFDGLCGLSGSQLNLSTTAITIGLVVSITSASFAQPAA